MAEIMFETLNVKGLFIGIQAVLALYGQATISGGPIASSEDLTGVVCDSGDGVTHIFPVCHGFPIAS